MSHWAVFCVHVCEISFMISKNIASLKIGERAAFRAKESSLFSGIYRIVKKFPEHQFVLWETTEDERRANGGAMFWVQRLPRVEGQLPINTVTQRMGRIARTTTRERLIAEAMATLEQTGLDLV